MGSLLAQGVDVDQRGEYDISALHLAALHGHTDTVERWENPMAIVTARGYRNYPRLLRGGASPNPQDAWGCTPLHNAAGKGFEEISRLLVEAGADLHVRADRGKSALDLAREKGHMEVVRAIQMELQRRWASSIGD